ncbi:MAG: hypothetical protein WC627_00510 [Legionella sp.]
MQPKQIPFIKLALFISALVAFVPVSPKLPTTSLDGSWAFGLNQAVAQGLAFGRDIIFTLGPYAAIYTKCYHPATELMMLAGSLYLACSYWFCLRYLLKNVSWIWGLGYILVLVAMVCSSDSLFFSYALIAGLASCKIVFDESFTNKNYLRLVLFFAPFGLLALIKGTFLIECFSTMLICSLFFIADKKYFAAFLSWTFVLISTCIFWLACGQSLIDLPSYLSVTITMAASFSQAMSDDFSYLEMALYGFNSLLLLLVVGGVGHSSLQSLSLAQCRKMTVPNSLLRYAFLILYAVFLFISFKSGFTRHYGHAVIAATSLLFAALILPFCIKSRLILPLMIYTLGTSYFIESQNSISFLVNAPANYSSFWHGMTHWFKDPLWMQRDYQLALGYLKNQANIPLLPGTTDIYSANQTHLIASGNAWSPRPIFQSYSVFTAAFAQANRRHLETKQGPDSIFFNLQAIDNRFPSLEDGASWPILLNHYHIAKIYDQFLLLQKNNSARVRQKKLIKEHHVLGEIVQLPVNNSLVFVSMDITPNVFGTIASILLAPATLAINLELSNGTKTSYKLIPSMARSKFLLSPLVENTQDFALLFHETSLSSKRVISFSISTLGGWQWVDDYELQYVVYL